MLDRWFCVRESSRTACYRVAKICQLKISLGAYSILACFRERLLEGRQAKQKRGVTRFLLLNNCIGQCLRNIFDLDKKLVCVCGGGGGGGGGGNTDMKKPWTCHLTKMRPKNLGSRQAM